MTRKEEFHIKANELCNDPKNDYKSTEDLCHMGMEYGFEIAIDKACEWIEDNLLTANQLANGYINKFKKAMEEEL